MIKNEMHWFFRHSVDITVVSCYEKWSWSWEPVIP